MSLTITIPGAVNVTTGAMAPAVLTVGVGVPGATGPAGPAGPGVPVGGTAGQYLQKIDGTNYNTDWVTVNLGAYAVKANNLSDLTNFGTARTNLGLGTMAVATAADYSTTTVANGLYYPLSGNPSSFLTASALSPYLTTATAASTYAVIAAGQPAAGTTGQVLTKNSGTNYDSSWATLIPGDRYLTSSTTSNTVSNGNKTFTIGTGLSYTPTQNITISYDASNHMHGEVLTYNSGTGVLTVDVNHHTGSGTYTAWVVNVGGVTPATSVAWGAITGTLSSQTDLQSALDLKLAATTAATTYYPLVGNPSAFLVAADIAGKAPLASPALTGNVTIVSNSAGAALFIEQAGTGNILTLHDQATDTNFVAIDANGKVNTIVADATTAGLNVPHTTVAPASPANGDIWTSTNGLFVRINGVIQQMMNIGNNQTVTGSITFSNASLTFGNSTAASTINIGTGATLTATTKTVNIGTGGVVGSTTLTTIGPVLGASTTSIGNTTAASTLNLATGATLTATTKAVNIGTSGVSGSTTTITIGSNFGTTTTVNGLLSTAASAATAGAGFRIAQGVAPTTPVNGDIWATSVRLFARINGATQALLSQADIGTSGVNTTQSVNIGTDATTSGQTKTVNIGTNGASGSLTQVNIGNTTNAANIGLNGRVVISAPGGPSQNGASLSFTSGTPANFGPGDIYRNGNDMFSGVAANMPCKLTAVKAYVNFSGTSSGTWAGGASTVTRTGGSTTCTVTTTTAHGLVQDNVVRALTGVVAGTYVITEISATQFSFTTVETTALSAVAITFAINTIRASQNVSSIADNGAGDYTVNFSNINIFPDVNYTALVGGCTTAGGGATNGIQAVEFITNATTLARTTAAYRFYTLNSAGVNTDAFSINAVFIR